MVLVAKARTILRQFEIHLGDLDSQLRAMLQRFGDEMPRVEYETLPSANFSSDLVARAAGLTVLCLPASAGWTDLGTEERLMTWLGAGRGATPRTGRLVRTPHADVHRVSRFTSSAANT